MMNKKLGGLAYLLAAVAVFVTVFGVAAMIDTSASVDVVVAWLRDVFAAGMI